MLPIPPSAGQSSGKTWYRAVHRADSYESMLDMLAAILVLSIKNVVIIKVLVLRGLETPCPAVESGSPQDSQVFHHV